jgi:hypothetical protein
MEILIILLTLAAGVVINVARGNSTWTKKIGLPGRPLWYVTPFIGLLAWNPWFAAAYLVAMFAAWGRWFDLGRMPDGYAREGIEPDPLEKIIMKLSFGNDYIAMLWRHAMGIPLLWFLLGPIALAYPFVVVVCYELGFRLGGDRAITLAEALVGFVWGAMIVAHTHNWTQNITF